MLYFRMLLSMVVSLYTVRVVLRTLGVVDYGIFNVVGGVVEMFSFLSITMASATQRFFSFELGRNDLVKLKRTFSLTVIIYALIAFIVLIMAESVGLWFLNNKMVIPLNRIVAANWIYQFSILSFIFAMMTIPYEAIIIARENMSFYAYISIAEVLLKLIIVYLLVLFSVDKLKLYGFLVFTITGIITYLYRLVCRRNYEESRFQYHWDKELFKTLINYSAWNLFGAITYVANNQGMNIILNIFFGPVVNAARAIAFRVSTSINSFSTNFYTAVNPQIVKSYASGKREDMITLVFKSSRISFYLLYIIALPILLELDVFLKIWLKNSTEYMVVFTRLAIVFSLINSLENPLTQTARATGDIKNYQVWVGSFTLLTLPISYILFKKGLPAETTFYTLILVYSIALFIRLLVLRKLINLSIYSYVKEVLFTVIFVSVLGLAIPTFIKLLIGDGFFQFFTVEISAVLWGIIVITVVGLKKDERQSLFNLAKSRFTKSFN